MPPEYISSIIEHLRKHYRVTANPEITLETNPGTVNPEKLAAFKAAGINRISIGIQSFDNADLKFLTRIHDKQTAINTVNAAKAAGIENINIDLIFNLPGQTKAKWLENLNTAMTLPITHISAYSLILERGTILNKMVLDGKVTLQDDDYDADLYEATISFLEERGFIQYEVSNFAKAGYKCAHNLHYWKYDDYLSFGPSAHSFMNGKRWHNISALNLYIKAVEEKSNAQIYTEELSQEERIEEYIMLALRSEGLNMAEFANMFDANWLKENSHLLEELIVEGFLQKEDSLLKLTSKGYPVCDEIVGKLL